MREKLSSIFLSPEVFVGLFLEFLLLVILSFTLLQSIFILKNYKYKATTELQYLVEKKSYLLSTIIFISFIVKIVLVGYFTYSLDELSLIVPGAMCAAGVLSSNVYGEPLLILKLIILLLASLWLLVHKADSYTKDSFYFKIKIYFFIVLYILILGELILSLNFFSSIETQNPVLCCSSIYTQDTNPIPFNLSKFELLISFCIIYFALMISLYKRKNIFILSLSPIFVYISYYAIVYFFSAYIYELPTHKCPFCMLQKEYFYIGYLIYLSLFLGVIYSFGAVFFKFMSYAFKIAIIFYTIFVSILFIYFLLYIFRNNVFL